MSNGALMTVSAMVMIAAASGAPPDSRNPPTAATLGVYQPKPHSLEHARRVLQEGGFEIGPAVGGTFAITGPRELFERFFGTELHPNGRGGVVIGDARTYELPADRLPTSLRSDVAIVTFSPPPEFGPGNP